MKISTWLPSALMVGIFGSLGCNGSNTVTGIDSVGGTRVAEDVQKSASPPAGLSGLWNGTITLHAYHGSKHGNNVVLPCSGIASILVSLSQDGQTLTGQIQSGCAGALEIHAVVVGDRLSGSLDSAIRESYGRIFGTVSANQIRFWTMKSIDENGDGAPDTHGDGSVRSSDVELHRSVHSERNSPGRLDASGRSPHVPAPRRP